MAVESNYKINGKAKDSLTSVNGERFNKDIEKELEEIYKIVGDNNEKNIKW